MEEHDRGVKGNSEIILVHESTENKSFPESPHTYQLWLVMITESQVKKQQSCFRQVSSFLFHELTNQTRLGTYQGKITYAT